MPKNTQNPNLPKTEYLTKTDFMKACECPTKLYFRSHSQYVSSDQDQGILKTTAEAGYQLGLLARIYQAQASRSECVEIEDSDFLSGSEITQRWLHDYESVTLFEAHLVWGHLAARADILVKDSDHIDLIEVKSKLINSEEGVYFWKKKVRALTGEWEPYIRDIAYQVFIAKKLFPDFVIEPYLYLPDASQKASVDHLNMRLQPHLKTFVDLEGTDLLTQNWGDPILTRVSVKAEVDFILQEWTHKSGQKFESFVQRLARAQAEDEFIKEGIGVKCKKCEYRVSSDDLEAHERSGFEKCWTSIAGLDREDLKRPLVFELWNYRESEQLIADQRYFLDEVLEDDLKEESSKDTITGMSVVDRQKIQLQKFKSGDDSEYFDRGRFVEESKKWSYPFYFVDFETTQMAVPFLKTQAPYETIAFQYSVHSMDARGVIAHHAQYINLEKGVFPSFDFLRSLREALGVEKNQTAGTVFCFSMHENSVLLGIYEQLLRSKEPDREDLMAWIQSLTHKTGKKSWVGSRAVVDQCALVKAFYYNPRTQGSNSLKKVLPAVIQSSPEILMQLQSPGYGSSSGVVSLNFKDWCWLSSEKGASLDPYQSLGEGSIKEGAAAMSEYSRCQFENLSVTEIEKIKTELLRYCELDTYAMAILQTHLQNLVKG